MNLFRPNLQCPACLQTFNFEERLPRVIQECHHIICTECLNQFRRNDSFNCPIDTEVVNCKNDQNEFTTFLPAFDIMNHLGEVRDFCNIHPDKIIDVVCLTCKVRICSSCGLTYHRDETHTIQLLEELKTPAIEEKIQRMKDHLGLMSETAIELGIMIEEKKQFAIRTIQEKFKDLESKLRSKERELTLSVNQLFNEEFLKMDHCLGGNSMITTVILLKLAEFANLHAVPNPFSLIDQDIDWPRQRIDIDYVYQSGEELGNTLREFCEDLNAQIDVQIQKSLEFNLFADEEKKTLFCENVLKTHRDLAEQLKIQEASDLNVPLEFNSAFDMELKDNNLELKLTNREPRPVMLTVNDWKKIEQITIKMKTSFISDDDLKSLNFLRRNCTDLYSIVLDAEYASTFNDISFIKIMETFCWRLELIEIIRVNLGKTQIGNLSISFIADKMLPKLSQLKNLSLFLRGTLITNQSLTAITPYLLLRASVFQSLQLDISETQVTEAGVIPLLFPMPHLQNLLLSVGRTNFSDNGVAVFAQNVLSNLNLDNLKSLKMSFFKTRVTNTSIRMLLRLTPIPRQFMLDLNSNPLRNEAVKEFIENIMPESRDVARSFHMYFDGTIITPLLKTKVENFNKSLAAVYVAR